MLEKHSSVLIASTHLSSIRKEAISFIVNVDPETQVLIVQPRVVQQISDRVNPVRYYGMHLLFAFQI